MLNKYKFITIMEGEFYKISIYEICVSNKSFIFMKQKWHLVAFATLKGCESM